MRYFIIIIIYLPLRETYLKTFKGIYEYQEQVIGNERCKQTNDADTECSFKLFGVSGFINNELIHVCISNNENVSHIYSIVNNV